MRAPMPPEGGLCASGRYDPNLWNGAWAKERRAAKAICAQCPMSLACLEYALDTQQTDGIYGGLDMAREGRKALRARRGEVTLGVG